MRLFEYDNAVVRMMDTVFSNVVFAYQDRQLWEAAKQEEQVRVKLPLIGINRVATILEHRARGNNPAVLKGKYFHDIGATAREIPVSLRYQLDFYSDKRDECEELWRETIRFLMDECRLVVNTEFDGKSFEHEFPFEFEDSPVDNTQVLSFEERGKLYRITQDFIVKNAVLLFIKKPDNPAGGLIRNIPVRFVTIGRGSIDTDSYTVPSV